MKKTSKRITVYLNDAAYADLISKTRSTKLSVSGQIKKIMEDHDRATAPVDEQVASSLTAIQIAVDALVKNHPNTKLFEVVTAVRADRLKRASHEA